MASEELVTRFAGALVDIVRPLESALQDDEVLAAMMLREGWRPPPDPYPMDVLRGLLRLPEELPKVVALIAKLQRQVSLRPSDMNALLDLGKALVEELRSIVDLPNGADVLPAPFDDVEFWTTFPPQLALRLLAEYLQLQQPAIYAPLLLTGVIDEELVPAESPGRVDFTRVDWHLDRLPKLLGDPAELAADVYGWGSALDHAKLLDRLERAALALGFDAGRLIPHHTLLDNYWPADVAPGVRELHIALAKWRDDQGHAEVGLAMLPIPPRAGGAEPTGLLVSPYGNVQLAGDVPLGGAFALQLRGTADLEDPFGLELRPDGVGGHVGQPSGTFDLGLSLAGSPQQPWLLFGAADTHRLEVTDLLLALELSGSLDDPELRLAARTSKVELVVDFGDADGFLAKVIGTEPQRFTAAGALKWSSKTGLSFEGSGSLRFLIPLDLQLGVVAIESVTVELAAAGGTAALNLGVTGGLALGPIAAAVEGVGVRAALRPRQAGAPPGLLGDLDLELGFKPPTAIGLAIDASVVRGGGFVYFDDARGEYGGVIQLEIAKTISVKAIGLIGTRLPDGSPGFTLFVLISAEGFAPFQLGMGFTLNGIGGLLGINRSVNIEPLRDGLKSGTLDSVLFPPDPVRNAPAIISTLNSVFPARRDHYVFGPMAIIGWGSPTLLTLKLGLLLEFPDPTRLILLGRLAVKLPTPDEPVVRLQLDAIGVLDFDRGELSLDASLFDSRVAAFVITGDMALRIGWGAEPQFVLSIGGFNPRLEAPPGMRQLERLAISLADSDNPRLRLEAYIAITSNTLQFGARLELYAEALGFTLEGHLGFDAFLQFVPFGFVIDFSAGVAVRFGGQVIFSVTLDVSLSGPSPWRAVGSASFTFLLIHATVAFDVQIGEGEPQPVLEPVDVRALLAEAIADPRNWASQLPADAPPLVSLRDGGGPGARVHPLAVLVVRERVVPLNRPIARYGSARLSGARRFTLTLTDSGGDPLPFDTEPVMESFARGQFEDLRDDEKLTLPSFEPMVAGLRLGRDELAFDADSVCDVEERFETWLWDPAVDPLPRPLGDVTIGAPPPEPRPVRVMAGLRP